MVLHESVVNWTSNSKSSGSTGCACGSNVLCHYSRIQLKSYKPFVWHTTDDSTQEASVSHVALDKGHTLGNKNVYGPRPKVLVVDDEQTIANTLALILNHSGFEARAVYSGEAAVEVVGSFAPDVLISDVVMTGMSGVEAAIAVGALRRIARFYCFQVRQRPPIYCKTHDSRDTALS